MQLTTIIELIRNSVNRLDNFTRIVDKIHTQACKVIIGRISMCKSSDAITLITGKTTVCESVVNTILKEKIPISRIVREGSVGITDFADVPHFGLLLEDMDYRAQILEFVDFRSTDKAMIKLCNIISPPTANKNLSTIAQRVKKVVDQDRQTVAAG